MSQTVGQTGRLVFVHVPKTAGSSVNGFLNYPMVTLGLNTLAFSGATTSYAEVALPTQLMEERGLDPDDFCIVTGHLPFGTAWRCFAPAAFVTVLREPRWRTISNYCSQPFARGATDFGMSSFLADVLRNPSAEWAIDNLQTRSLCDDPCFGKPVTVAMLEAAQHNLADRFQVVGFQDNLSEFYESICALYHLPMEPDLSPKLNVTGSYHVYVTDEHLAFAADLNPFDIQLHVWAREKFSSSAPRSPMGLTLHEPGSYRKVELGASGSCRVLVDSAHLTDSP